VSTTVESRLLAQPPTRPPALTVTHVPLRTAPGLWTGAWRRLRRNRLAMIGLAFVSLVVAVAVLGDVLAPYDPTFQFSGSSYARPTPQHPLGMDDLGRDILSRLIHGARVSLTVALSVQLLALTLGVLVGGTAGYFGGRIDNWLMRFTDVFYAFPDLLLAIIVAAAIGPGNPTLGILSIVVAIGVSAWTDLARLTRGQLLALREREYVLAARSLGASGVRITLQHLLPNAAGPMVVRLTYGLPLAIQAEAVLSFIGLGLRPPNASWGSMIERGNQAIFSAPHMVLFPGLAIALTMLAFNFLGDGLRDALDPRATN
jgi:ABC-type dipeptide/oligopeptide/nickel transport system permease subunit